jgi:hypothetical protein
MGGDICPPGTFCPLGTITPRGCPAGSYNSLYGQWRCQSCPAGYFCLANATTFTRTPCPAGYYCPVNTTYAAQYPCPAGTFSNRTLNQAISDCTKAPPGYFASGLGRTAVS